MATKTFKIGLNNAEKQAMAQDVYERLLDLTFPEYDPTQNYNVGDFVVYNDQLYKCIEGTTGAWDSSKWQLATFNDLLTDIEDAVAFVNDKANVDGNYPTMTVGVADNLSPYDESSGINQSAPFNFQASGTNNGADPLATVGELALLKEKRGNTVVVNQGINHSNMPGTSTIAGITITNNGDGILTANGTQSGDALNYWVSGNYGQNNPIYNFIANHKYLISELLIFVGTDTYITSNKKLGEGFIITTPAISFGATGIRLADTNGSISNYRFTPIIIDLTKWFNGDIPQDLLDNPDHFFRYYQGSLAYNEGTLVNSNGRYIKAIGRNQWDEENLQGYYDANTGVFVSASGNLASKNPIRVNPNTELLVYQANNPQVGTLCFYDANNNFISTSYFNNGTVITVPSNAIYAQLSIGGYGTSYNNDISIYLVYWKDAQHTQLDGEHYNTYTPYEELANVDTGSEVLRSASNAHDVKLPSGEIKRNVKQIVIEASNLVVFQQSAGSGINQCVTNILLNDCLDGNAGDMNSYGISSIGYQVQRRGGYWTSDFSIQLEKGQYITIANSSLISLDDFKALCPITLNYQLNDESKTTEQGTPFSENIAINDFGSMDFNGTNGVPQGNALFYPVDYKAFIDTLHNYTDGDPSNIALNSDLSGLVPQEDLSDEITEVASGLTYVLKKAYKTGNVVNLSIDVENNTGLAINENTTLFAIGSDLLPIPSQLNIIGYYAGEPCRVQINKSGQVGNVSINKQFEYAARLTILVSYAVA